MSQPEEDDDVVDDEEERLTLVGDYKHGSIRRVSLTNFLTYSDAVINPGPRLNMVIGPNGTGKSTILCAICLGLGGEPNLLGRASAVETFIMNGQDEGEVEIEIHNEHGDNPIIKRSLRREGSPKSSFTWNGNHISAKALRETILKEYNICVNNLCTFLPQDKVGGFSGFDSKQLLEETEKALSASQDLYTTHQELIQKQEDLNSGASKVEAMTEKLQQLQAENARLEREKQRMEEREIALKDAELLQKKIVWLKFDEAQQHAVAKRQEKEEAKYALVEARTQVQPLEQHYQQLDGELKGLEKKFKDLDSDIKVHKNAMIKQKQKYETYDDNIELVLQELHALDTHRTNLEMKVQTNREKVDFYKAQLKEFPSLTEMQQEEQKAREEFNATRPELEGAKRELSKLQEDADTVKEEVRRIQTKWAKMQDEKARRQERIFRQQEGLRKITEWIQQNRNNFRKEVVGPIVCEITPKSEVVAAYLEQHVPNAALKSFIVRDKKDYDFLYNSVRVNLKLPINIYLVENVPAPKPRIYSDKKMGVLKESHGVLGYMDETFAAPPVVMQVLKDAALIDRVLIGGEQTQRSLDSDNLLNFLSEPEEQGGRLLGCSVFASEKGGRSFKYTSIISKYSGKPSLRVDQIKPAKWLAPGVSEEEKQRVKQEKDEIDQKMADSQPAIDAAKTRYAQAQEKAQGCREQMKTAKENVLNMNKMINKLRNAERKLKDSEDALNVDDEEEKRQKIEQLNKRIHQSLLALEAQSESYNKMMEATIKCSGFRLNKERVEIEAHKARQAWEDVRRSLVEAENTYAQVNQEFKDAKKMMHQAKTRADQEAPLHDKDQNELPLMAQLQEIAHNTVEDAEAALEEAEAKANAIVADPNVVRQYESRQLQMEEVQAELDNLTSSKDDKKAELEQKLRPWEQKLDNAVERVDKLFSQYMQELGCTGTVVLNKGEAEGDEGYGSFSGWGVEIRVSFREGVKPEVLSARVQSGGERSVSTIMYLMALQDMMVAPFRCVDEINQGLDDRNERLVFRRIVENSCKSPGPEGSTDHSGQYFLITPKLLPNLYDMEVEAITVLFIFNGAHNFKAPTDWNIDRFLEVRKRELEADDEERNNNDSDTGDASPSPSKKAKVSDTVDD